MNPTRTDRTDTVIRVAPRGVPVSAFDGTLRARAGLSVPAGSGAGLTTAVDQCGGS